MPVDYSISGRLVRLRMVGQYTPTDMTGAFLSALSDDAFPDDAVLLVDSRFSEELAARPSESVKAVAQIFVLHAERFGRRCALLTGSDAQFGVARIGAAYAEQGGADVGVFSEEGPALAWLGLAESN